MKKQYKLIAALSALLILSGCFPVFTVKADDLPEETAAAQNDSLLTDEAFGQENITTASEDEDSSSFNENLLQETTFTVEENLNMPIPDEPPVFNARIEYNPQGYVVMGTFTEFPPDTSFAWPVWSLDGEIYQACVREWALDGLGSEDVDVVSKLQNQICLYPTDEPLKSYLVGTLDRFYLKLRITRESGITYDTQAAIIERSFDPRPIPEETSLNAKFASSIYVRESNPFRSYGKYQLTVSADASPEDIARLLPSTLPVEVQLIKNSQADSMTGIIDCPVTWKPLSLPSLTAGESVTIMDAAEEIIIPCGTLVNTPTGTFELHEPLRLGDGAAVTDEIMLILNVVSENENPTGGLSANNTGLEMFFNLKPTGASSIQAYVLSEGDSEWTQLSSPPIPSEINSHFSSAGGNYALVLRNDQEPYKSYLAANNIGEAATPFLIGLKIEGGVYDKCQLILPWPDTYESPLRPFDLAGGMGGNENNAGAGNKSNSTAEGQRPDLSRNSEENPETITVSDTLSEIEILHENQQNPAKEHVPEKTIASAPPVLEIQTTAGIHAQKPYPALVPALNEKADSQVKPAAAKVHFSEPDVSATPVLADEKEKTDSDMGISQHKSFLPPILISSAAIICLAAIGKLTASRIFGRSEK